MEQRKKLTKEEMDALRAEFEPKRGEIEAKLRDVTCQLNMMWARTAYVDSSLPSLRSNGAGEVIALLASNEGVQDYLDKVEKIAEEARAINWPRMVVRPPAIYADLSNVHATGDLRIKANVSVVFGSSTCAGSLYVSVLPGCGKFEAPRSAINRLIIDMSQAESTPASPFSLVLSDSQRRVELDVMSNTGLRPIFVNLRGAQLGDVKLTLLDVRNITADKADFGGALHVDRCDLNIARFAGCTFSNGWQFEHCDFSSVPNFIGANMDRQYTRFYNCVFLKAGNFLSSHSSGEDVAKYRYLRTHFSRQKDIAQENIFYSLEQRSQRLCGEDGFFDRWLSTTYDAFSNYGNSVGRPVLFFIAQIFIFVVIYGLLGGVDGKGLFSSYPAVGLSLQNAFNPLALFTEKGVATPTGLAVYGVSLLQAVLSVSLIALTLIGLRSRFKKGGGESS
ncbi:MAG: pentapeptide repeat-containing protein [Ralstonia sp.]|uniref:pentapeptide repeat-containing protein n=1 Tax=Ralstonia sp. TaxID=54061 RepID=UPI003F7E79B3